VKILHIVAGVPPGGGIAESVPSLCRHLRQLGHEVALCTLDGPLSEAAQAAEAAGVRLVRFAPSFPHALYFSCQMLRGLPALARAADVVHVHGAWTFPVWWACRCALRAHKPLVMSPRGALNPVYLKHSAWKKGLVGWLDRACLRRAAVIHATAAGERDWVRAYLGTCDAEIAMIPNGIDIEDFSRKGGKTPSALTPLNLAPAAPAAVEPLNLCTSAQRDGTFEPSRPRTVLYLGRLHPLKGLDLLIEAWARLRSSKVLKCESALVGKMNAGDVSRQDAKTPSEWEPARSAMEPLNLETIGWNLVIAGPDEQGTLARLKAQAEKCGLSVADFTANQLLSQPATPPVPPDILFTGPVYGERKGRLLSQADLFVLPTRSDNFGIAVAEALASGVPVISTKGAPWAELLGNSASALVHYCESSLVGNDQRSENGSQRSEVSGTNDLMNFRTNELTRTGRAGWWVDIGAEPLAAALREAMRLTDEQRRAMGENGQRLVERKYRWETVAEKMAAAYSACLRG